MKDICALCSIFLLPMAVLARPMRRFEQGNGQLEEKEYEADARDATEHAARRAAMHRQNSAEQELQDSQEPQPGGEASQYRIVDYGGNTFLQRVRGASAPAAAALDDTLIRKQRMYEEHDGANFGDKVDGSAPKGKYMGLGTTYNDHINSKNIPAEVYSTSVEEEQHDSDNQESLAAPNKNYRHVPRARAHFHDKPTRNNPQYSDNHLDDKMKATLMAISQESLDDNGRINRNNIYQVHQSDEQTKEKDAEQPNHSEYGGSDYVAPNFVNGKDDEPMHNQNVNTYENDNVETGDYEEASIGNLESARDRRNVNEVAAPNSAEAEAKPQPAPTSREIHDGMSKDDESIEEKEQQAIKRHIASLSEDQLDELLNSLSPDKRELLQEIIGSDKTAQSEVVNKREATKKEGATEVDNIHDNQQSDDNKANLQESSFDKNCKTAVSQESERLESSKFSKNSKIAGGTNDNIELSNNKKSEEKIEAINSEQQSALADVDGEKPEVTNEETNLSKDQVSGDSGKSDELLKKDGSAKDNEQPTSFSGESEDTEKDNIKREIKINDYGSHQYDIDENLNTNGELSDNKASPNPYIENQKVKWTNYKGQSELNHENLQPLKRDLNNKDGKISVKEMSLSKQLKALEDSFPSVSSYDESNYQLGPLNMTPLIRVKRNKRAISAKKRAAAIVPDAKATYLPYRADTEDEDDDEGNEFEDDGFFDRTSNLAKDHSHALSANKEAMKIEDSDDKNFEFKEQDSISKETVNFEDTSSEDLSKGVKNNYNSKDSLHEVPKSPISNLGSDTDNVLSGAEGADENLMLTSGARIRLSRDTDKDLNNIDERNGAYQEFADAKRIATEELESIQNDPNGAFGGLPKNYDGELSRYKRIRRTKQHKPAA